jgi:uncharacterized protein (DUF58 family)
VAERATPRHTDRNADDLFDEAFQKRLEYLAIVSRRIVAGQNRADRRSKRTGGGVEFADHRQYSPGDDYRFLDWKVYGRLGRLLLRLYEEEEDLSVYILLDSSASMGVGNPSKLRFAKRLTAALAYIGLSHLDRVSVVTMHDGIAARLPPTRSKGRIFGVFDFLRDVEATGKTNLARAARTFVAQNKRRGVVIVISDLFDPDGFETALNTLRYAKFEPYVVQLTSAADRADHVYGDMLLVDSETGQEREVTITASLLEQYKQAYAALCEHNHDVCTRKHVPLFTLDVAADFEEAVLRMLRHGGMVS